MGLGKNKEIKKIEMRLEFLEFLKEYGVEVSDLHYLHEAVEYIKEIRKNNLNENRNINVPDATTKKKYEEDARNKMTPEEFISMFAGESEEFYPYGKPKENNN